MSMAILRAKFPIEIRVKSILLGFANITLIIHT